ncbi:hypothetical protein F7734_04050 [Scytonema sp. UIC 10036]|uniref:hypothetical protein n=1 Tax=Scytonema sp. UIC 10036 TaxID=2304196 RepID=UPI0012DAA71B|nr:hypothetical protein [Scytonema sp. UIC 10036]MUG91697.1 hypothetical protein [Scytonema sp. UIC 10036]
MFRTILGIAALVAIGGTVIGFSSEAGQCGVVVATCNYKCLNQQSRHFSARIICN